MGAVAVTFGALLLTGRVSFDQNLLKLQAEQTEAVKFENVLLKDSGRSSWFAVSLAPSIEAGEARAAAFRKLPEVSDVETISTYIPDDEAAKLKTLHGLSAMLAPIKMAPLQHPGDPTRLARELGQLAGRLNMIRVRRPVGRGGRNREVGANRALPAPERPERICRLRGQHRRRPPSAPG